MYPTACAGRATLGLEARLRNLAKGVLHSDAHQWYIIAVHGRCCACSERSSPARGVTVRPAACGSTGDDGAGGIASQPGQRCAAIVP